MRSASCFQPATNFLHSWSSCDWIAKLSSTRGRKSQTKLSHKYYDLRFYFIAASKIDNFPQSHFAENIVLIFQILSSKFQWAYFLIWTLLNAYHTILGVCKNSSALNVICVSALGKAVYTCLQSVVVDTKDTGFLFLSEKSENLEVRRCTAVKSPFRCYIR